MKGNAVQESTLTIKGQTTVPRQVREALGLGPGDKLRYLVLDDGEVRLMRSRKVASLSGALRRDGPAVTLQQMDAAIADAACAGGTGQG